MMILHGNVKFLSLEECSDTLNKLGKKSLLESIHNDGLYGKGGVQFSISLPCHCHFLLTFPYFAFVSSRELPSPLLWPPLLSSHYFEKLVVMVVSPTSGSLSPASGKQHLEPYQPSQHTPSSLAWLAHQADELYRTARTASMLLHRLPLMRAGHNVVACVHTNSLSAFQKSISHFT